MPIEVTSVPETQRTLPILHLSRLLRSRPAKTHINVPKVVCKTLIILCSLTLVSAGAAMMRSYGYYSRIVDARLAHGYLTSRPGLYAAPRVLQAGQKLSQEKLLSILRRAGYVESEASDVWSGSFESRPGLIEIRPNRIGDLQPQSVSISFADDQIIELKGDQASIESFQLQPETLSNDQSSKSGKREILNYSEIPTPLVHAILSIEDRRFFAHAGVDFSALLRAFLRNVSDEQLGQGGSTLTQQLVKNTYLTPEKSLRRKYAEAMLAIALERRLSKEDIFALYCNEVYLGQRGAVAVRGVKEAAEIYFGKELKDLTLGEAATIAGMVQGPARYSPVRHPDVAKDRRNAVLLAMQHNGWINASTLSAASAEEITVAPQKNSDNSLAPYFVDYVNRIADAQFETSGDTKRIFTTIDLELQQSAEQALKHQLDRLDVVYKDTNKTPQAALVALDPHNGNILAMVGGRDYAESQLNRATDARRQPGSTFKPFVYAAALEDGMSPVQMFMDAPREFVYDHNRVYRPANYGGGYSMREVTMRTGLVKSLNVVTVDVALQTGLARISNLATRFGLPKPERYPALALGTEEVTPLQLASGYGVFANGGLRVEPRVIAGISEPPAAHSMANESQVISATSAYIITNMLSAVIDHGTARKARGAVKGSAVAGKTGTSRDGWFVGYTPNLVCAVWIGFDDNEQLGLTGAEAALPAWVEFMNGALGVRPDLGATNFECPEGIRFAEIDSTTGLLSTLSCPQRELIAVTERGTPNMECYFHSNVPAQGSPFADEVETKLESTVAQVKKNGRRDETGYRPYRSTSVEVDPRGRRTLVNEMR